MRSWIFSFFAGFGLISTAVADPVHDAAESGDAAALASLLDSGADFDKSDGIATPLYYAVYGGHLTAAKLLVSRGADVNFAAKWGPPLMAAAETGKPEFVKLLLDAGADAAVVFKQHTALHAAAGKGCLDCVVALIEKGADVNALNSLRQPPLHFAKKKGHEAVAGYLLSHGHTIPAPPPVAQRLAMANAVKGEELFKRMCRKCHFSEPDRGNFVGPSLWDVVGRKRGAIRGYKYSAVLRGMGGEWTYENLNIFISDPSRSIPGIDMAFEGVQDDAGRADIIAFLRGKSSKPLPLP